MARVLFGTYGSLGDLHPVLAQATALRARGHRVEIATSELYREKITALRFASAPLRPEPSTRDEELVQKIMDGPHGSEFLLRDLMMPAVVDMYDDLSRLTADGDLLVTSEL